MGFFFSNTNLQLKKFNYNFLPFPKSQITSKNFINKIKSRQAVMNVRCSSMLECSLCVTYTG